MIPPRLALRAIRELSVAELEARLPRDEKYLTGILIRPAGTDAFGWLQPSQRVQAGDDVLLYAIDKTDVDQINALNKEFDRHYYPPQRGLSSDESELVRTRFPARDARVLEVCCGAGRITSHLVREGNRVAGLDFNRHCLAVARGRDGTLVDYVLGDATALPFADGSFDITCWRSLSTRRVCGGSASSVKARTICLASRVSLDVAVNDPGWARPGWRPGGDCGRVRENQHEPNPPRGSSGRMRRPRLRGTSVRPQNLTRVMPA